jgi:DNA topoisomerase-1
MENPESLGSAEEISTPAEAITWVFDEEPGLRRRRRGKGFAYVDANQKPIDASTRRRIKALVIPPAWNDVWICPNPNGHIQATGRDLKGRKQYIYHPQFRQWREQQKFERILDFAEALPKLRRKVAEDLNDRRLSRTLVLATAVRVLDRTLMRIGNDEYAKQNQSYGLTTLLIDHIETAGQRVQFSFRAKSGKPFEAELNDRRVAAILRRLEGLPGQYLFQYLDESGEPQRITSEDVNAYIREASQGEFSAKDFRTWAATVLAVTSLLELEPASNPTATKKNIAQAIKKVAQRLGNTPAVCRASYVHPEVLDSYRDGSLSSLASKLELEEELKEPGLAASEKQVLRFLRSRARQAKPQSDQSLRISLTASLRTAVAGRSVKTVHLTP